MLDLRDKKKIQSKRPKLTVKTALLFSATSIIVYALLASKGYGDIKSIAFIVGGAFVLVTAESVLTKIGLNFKLFANLENKMTERAMLARSQPLALTEKDAEVSTNSISHLRKHSDGLPKKLIDTCMVVTAIPCIFFLVYLATIVEAWLKSHGIPFSKFALLIAFPPAALLWAVSAFTTCFIAALLHRKITNSGSDDDRKTALARENSAHHRIRGNSSNDEPPRLPLQ